MPLFSSLGERQVCKPRTELFLQPLNFKRKRLQIHFARDEIFLFSGFFSDLQDWASKERIFYLGVLPRFSKKSVPNQSPWAGTWISKETNHGMG